MSDKENSAAVVLQSLCRGHIGRKKFAKEQLEAERAKIRSRESQKQKNTEISRSGFEFCRGDAGKNGTVLRADIDVRIDECSGDDYEEDLEDSLVFHKAQRKSYQSKTPTNRALHLISDLEVIESDIDAIDSVFMAASVDSLAGAAAATQPLQRDENDVVCVETSGYEEVDNVEECADEEETVEETVKEIEELLNTAKAAVCMANYDDASLDDNTLHDDSLDALEVDFPALRTEPESEMDEDVAQPSCQSPVIGRSPPQDDGGVVAAEGELICTSEFISNHLRLSKENIATPERGLEFEEAVFVPEEYSQQHSEHEDDDVDADADDMLADSLSTSTRFANRGPVMKNTAQRDAAASAASLLSSPQSSQTSSAVRVRIPELSSQSSLPQPRSIGRVRTGPPVSLLADQCNQPKKPSIHDLDNACADVPQQDQHQRRSPPKRSGVPSIRDLAAMSPPEALRSEFTHPSSDEVVKQQSRSLASTSAAAHDVKKPSKILTRREFRAQFDLM